MSLFLSTIKVVTLDHRQIPMALLLALKNLEYTNMYSEAIAWFSPEHVSYDDTIFNINQLVKYPPDEVAAHSGWLGVLLSEMQAMDCAHFRISPF